MAAKSFPFFFIPLRRLRHSRYDADRKANRPARLFAQVRLRACLCELHINFVVQFNLVTMHASETPATCGTLLNAYFDILVLDIYLVSDFVKE